IYENLSKGVDSVGNPIPLTALPAHELIGAFYWAIVTEDLLARDSSRMSAPIHIHREPPLADTVIQAKYGSATILIDGIRYE
ncbi:MAG TPA: hypothetical protein VK465_17155, partial [Fibrobacteria bacterium]|nr:hypothetical protein [Fibrobacteria bacterium]